MFKNRVFLVHFFGQKKKNESFRTKTRSKMLIQLFKRVVLICAFLYQLLIPQVLSEKEEQSVYQKCLSVLSARNVEQNLTQLLCQHKLLMSGKTKWKLEQESQTQVLFHISSENCGRFYWTNYECRQSIPVCGSDGLTYKNPCHFQSRFCSNASLTIAHRGPCGGQSNSCFQNCHQNFSSVICGSDGSIYENKCHFHNAHCLDPALHQLEPSSCTEIVHFYTKIRDLASTISKQLPIEVVERPRICLVWALKPSAIKQTNESIQNVHRAFSTNWMTKPEEMTTIPYPLNNILQNKLSVMKDVMADLKNQLSEQKTRKLSQLLLQKKRLFMQLKRSESQHDGVNSGPDGKMDVNSDEDGIKLEQLRFQNMLFPVLSSSSSSTVKATTMSTTTSHRSHKKNKSFRRKMPISENLIPEVAALHDDIQRLLQEDGKDKPKVRDNDALSDLDTELDDAKLEQVSGLSSNNPNKRGFLPPSKDKSLTSVEPSIHEEEQLYDEAVNAFVTSVRKKRSITENVDFEALAKRNKEVNSNLARVEVSSTKLSSESYSLVHPCEGFFNWPEQIQHLLSQVCMEMSKMPRPNCIKLLQVMEIKRRGQLSENDLELLYQDPEASETKELPRKCLDNWALNGQQYQGCTNKILSEGKCVCATHINPVTHELVSWQQCIPESCYHELK